MRLLRWPFAMAASYFVGSAIGMALGWQHNRR